MSATVMNVRQLAGRYGLWALLALPSVPMMVGLWRGSAQPDLLLHPSGEFATRFMILALALTPLRLMFPKVRWLAWLAQRRRALGVAAFGYAALHTVLYLVDMGTLRSVLAEFWTLGIWTGWAAFAIFLPLAVTSNDLSTRRLGRTWKHLHRAAYAAAFFTLIHWIFVRNNLGPALVHFIPLAALEMYRIVKQTKAVKGAAATRQSY